MTDDEVRKRMAEWVGWHYREADKAIFIAPGYWRVQSDADLAEAVRAKFWNEWNVSTRSLRAKDVREQPIVERIWLREGPIPFLRAVLEVLKDET